MALLLIRFIDMFTKLKNVTFRKGIDSLNMFRDIHLCLGAT